MRASRLTLTLALAAAVWACSPGDAAAAEPGALFATAYWENFKEYWVGAVRKQNGIVMMTLLVGAISIFILTRSKAKK